jgi:hypothetical protein
MILIPKEFSRQISAFTPLFTKKVFEHAKILLMAGTPVGSILVVGRRTVCSALRTVGLEQEKQFHKYHRVLNLAKWSAHQVAHILLELLVHRFIPASDPIVFGIDETLERRWGNKIKAKRIYGTGHPAWCYKV